MIAVISIPGLATERTVQAICATLYSVAKFPRPPTVLDLDVIDYATFAVSYGEWKASNGRILLARGTAHLSHLAATLLAEGIPLIVCADSHLGMKTCRAEAGRAFFDALRHCSRSLATSHSIAESDGRLLVLPRRSLRESVSLLARLLDATEADILSAAGDVADCLAFGDDDSGCPNDDDSTDEERQRRQLMISALGTLASQPGSVEVHDLYWPKPLFYEPPHGRPYTAPHVELTGRARVLLYGPYMHLPKGKWIAIPEFTLSGNVSGTAFHIDVFNGEVLSLGRLDVPNDGRFSTRIPFVIDDPNLPVQVRFISEQGAIEGFFDLQGVRMLEASHADMLVPRTTLT